MAVSDVGKDRQLYTTREGDIRCEPDKRAVLADRFRLQLQGEMEFLVAWDNLAVEGAGAANLVE